MHPLRPRTVHHALALGALALLAACGGGGGDTPAVSATTVNLETTTGGTAGASTSGSTSSTSGGSTTTTSSSGGGTSGTSVAGVTTLQSGCAMPDFQATLLAQLNARRANGATCRSSDGLQSSSFAPGAPALRWHAQLAQAAQSHSSDMATRDYFAHDTLNGATWDQRILAITGPVWTMLAENLAQGQTSVDAVVGELMASYHHCLNIMNAAYTDVGAACVARVVDQRTITYTTMDFGKLR